MLVCASYIYIGMCHESVYVWASVYGWASYIYIGMCHESVYVWASVYGWVSVCGRG
jgi:hypothetical protein